MAPPPAEELAKEENQPAVEDDYDEDDYDSGADEDDADADYREGGGDEDEEEEEEDEEADDGGRENLTRLLIAKDGKGDEEDEDDEDEDEDDEDDPYVPGGGIEPAEQEVDGDAHDDVLEVAANGKGPAAAGLKRKTSGDEDDAEEVNGDDVDQEAKRVKV